MPQLILALAIAITLAGCAVPYDSKPEPNWKREFWSKKTELGQ